MLKTAARTQVSGVLKQMVQGAVKYVAASPEFIWSDSGATTADTLGTVGAIALRGLRAFRFSHTLAFDPSIAGDPVIAASGLAGLPLDVLGITGGDLVKGPSWQVGYGDALAITVQSEAKDAIDYGVLVNTVWNWDGGTSYLTLAVTVGADGTPQVDEHGRDGAPDDNSWY